MMHFTTNHLKNQVLLLNKRGVNVESKDKRRSSRIFGRWKPLWKERTGEGHLCLALFVARNRDLLSLFNSRKERGCFEPTCGMNWNDKTQAVFYSPSRHLCVSVCSFPVGHIVNLPQIHWLKTTITIYLWAHDAVIGEGLAGTAHLCAMKCWLGRLDWSFTQHVAAQLRCPEQLGAVIWAQGSRRRNAEAVRPLER